MNNPKYYLKPENIDKLYLIKLKNTSILPAYVDEVRINGVEQICFTYYEDFECYVEKDIEEVLQELPEDFTDNCDSCNDGKIDIHKTLNGETTCDSCLQQQHGLVKFKTTLPDVYKYNSIEELQELYKVLDCPIPDGVKKDRNTQTLIVDDLKHSFGLVYTWSHWDDFSDYPLDYCAVIDGGMLSD